MKIGDEIYIHGYIDEIRTDTVIIKNDDGYFGTVEPEVVLNQPESCGDAVSRQRLLSDLKELIAAWEKYPFMAEQIKGVEAAIGYVAVIPSVTPQPKIEERTAESAQNVLDGDLISRKAVIDLWDKYYSYISVKAAELDCMLRKLSPVQPEYYDYSDIEPLWKSFAEENDINLTDTAKQLKDAMWCGYRKGKADAQLEPSQVARDIADIIENEKDMRVIARSEIIRCKECREFRRWIDTDITFCDRTESEVKEDDFCSKAERRNDE